jgi:hypothetical protein
MDWLSRGRRSAAPAAGDAGPPPAPEPRAERPPEAAAPGVAALLEDVAEDGAHTVLDLGAGAPSSFHVYCRYARRIRFADVPGQLIGPHGLRSVEQVLTSLPAQPAHPYDLVFAWDVLDRLLPEYRAPVVARLAEITAPGAKLHVIARAMDGGSGPQLRFALLDTSRMTYQPLETAGPATPRITPAHMAQILAPFRVVHGFTLKGELREYVAQRHS